MQVGKKNKRVLDAVNEIYEDFEKNSNQYIGVALCFQRYIESGFPGHVSNEIRLSNTRNQWKFEIEKPYSANRGINSIFVEPPDESTPLPANPSTLDRSLRQLCHWVNSRVAERMHIEWVLAQGCLWVVQLDREAPTSDGVNPNVVPGLPEQTTIEDGRRSYVFERFHVGDDLPWRKLINVNDFWIDYEAPKHCLYFSDALRVNKLLSGESGRERLENEIEWLTQGRAVIRTDCVDPNIPKFNLPRTYTVNGGNAVQWLVETIELMREKGALLDKVAFILHRYIPARASAWSFYEPGSAFVHIDCLWGLPDGLQFLSHDSHQIDAKSGRELSATIRYKANFLQEQPDGTWQYVRVARQFGRTRVMSRDALRHIADQTVRIAERVRERAHVMWFCDVPASLGLGNHLPWYRSKEYLPPIDRARPLKRRTIVIRTLGDIDKAEKESDANVMLRVEPDADLVRDDSNFLDRLVNLARDRELPIELSGSVLGHAYYRLVEENLTVVTESPAHYRARGRVVYGKLVRDSIPAAIAKKGENVRSAQLHSKSTFIALLGKLFEECFELAAAEGPENEIEELGDILEVARGLSSALNVSWDSVKVAANKKREARGGFEKGTILIETALPKSASPDTVVRDQMISLEDLSQITISDSQATVPVARLLQNEPISVEIPFRNVSVVLELHMEGSNIVAEIQPPLDKGPSAFQPDLFSD